MAMKTIDLNKIPPYEPPEADKKTLGEVEGFYDSAITVRQPHESQWYLNSAFIRGQQWVQWDTQAKQLVTPPAPTYKIRRVFNLIKPKVKARAAKFLRGRPHPEVKAASQDIKDILNARMTTKALDYIWRKLHLEEKYAQALGWAQQAGHGYWWLSWDESIVGRVQYTDPATGEKQISEAELGDLVVEVGSPFEVLVADPAIDRLGDQPKIMRTKVRSLDYVRQRFPDKGKFVHPESTQMVNQGYDRSIATMASSHSTSSGLQATGRISTKDEPNQVIVKELFCRPSGAYSKGKYIVVANGVLLKEQDELPYEMFDMGNPYPVIDFVDGAQPGQYWVATDVEQMITPQRQYNLLRSKIEEQIRMMAYPKLLVAKQHRVAPGAWNNMAGEMVEYVAHPNIPPPTTWTPPNIATDVWKVLELLRTEIDTISRIHPESEGQVGQATSGFQTNLLQEATDSVHAPDIRAHELAVEEAAIKFRHMMKLLYSLPRLIVITSQDEQVEAFEFSQADIDQNADIIVQAGSGLPMLKGARIQMALELRNARVFGNPDDPEVNRKVLSMLELGEFGSLYADSRRDEERARLENVAASEGNPVDEPLFCDNHNIHYTIHTDQMKSSSFKAWPEPQQIQHIQHLLWHATYVNPAAAQQIAAIYQLPAPVLPQPAMAQGGGAQQPPPGGAPPPQGPPQAGPQGAPQTPPPQASGANQASPEFGFGPQGSEATMPM